MNNQTISSEEYVDRTLARLQKSFRLTLGVAIFILAAEGIYLTVLNSMLADRLTVVDDYAKLYRGEFDTAKEWMGKIPAKDAYADKIKTFETALEKVNEAKNPKGAAAMISKYIVNELDWQKESITDRARIFLQGELDDLPEQLGQLIPKYSARFRHEVDNWTHNFFGATSEGMGTTFDAFLDTHADQIREFSEAADDETALDKLDAELTVELARFLESTSLEKYGTLQDQSNRMLARIRAANELLQPLALKKIEDMTPEERRLSRAVGIFMKKLQSTPAGEDATE